MNKESLTTKIIKANWKGWLISSICVIAAYPLIHLIQFSKHVPIVLLLKIIPVVFVGTGLFMFLIGFLIGAEK